MKQKTAYISCSDVTEPAKIRFCRIQISCVKSIWFVCGFVTQSQLVRKSNKAIIDSKQDEVND